MKTVTVETKEIRQKAASLLGDSRNAWLAVDSARLAADRAWARAVSTRMERAMLPADRAWLKAVNDLADTIRALEKADSALLDAAYTESELADAVRGRYRGR